MSAFRITPSSVSPRALPTSLAVCLVFFGCRACGYRLCGYPCFGYHVLRLSYLRLFSFAVIILAVVVRWLSALSLSAFERIWYQILVNKYQVCMLCGKSAPWFLVLRLLYHLGGYLLCGYRFRGYHFRHPEVLPASGAILQTGSRKKTQMYSPVNVHAVFSIQTVKFFTRPLLCALAKISPQINVFCLFA